MGRSIGAVALGFLYALAMIWLTQLVLWFCLPGELRDDETEAVPQARLVWTVASGCAGAALAGFITAQLAAHVKMTHGLALGTVLTALLALTTGLREADFPAWYRFALPATALPGALFGAFIRTRLRRRPPPVLPKTD
jgi:hypothetical protein